MSNEEVRGVARRAAWGGEGGNRGFRGLHGWGGWGNEWREIKAKIRVKMKDEIPYPSSLP